MNIYEVAFLGSAEREASQHLLQHFRIDKLQEDLCFALWRPSTGKSRYTGIIYKTILPEKTIGNFTVMWSSLLGSFPKPLILPFKRRPDWPLCTVIHQMAGKT